MPLPVIADTFRVACTWECVSQTAVNVMHIKSSTLDAEGVFNLLDASNQTHQFEGMNETASVTSMEVLPLDGTSVAFVGEPSGWQGSSGTGQWSPASSILIKFATAIRGRSYRGRFFMPFVVESIIEDGFIPVANADEITGAWVDFANALVAGDAALVVASYLHATSEQVVNLRCETALATQRRRQSRLRT